MIIFHFYTEVSPALYFQTLPPLAKTAHTFIHFFLLCTIILQQYAKKAVLYYILFLVCFSTCLYISIPVAQMFPSSI